MQLAPPDHALVPENQLRFVFNDTVVSVGLAANSTLGDVARTLRGLSGRYCDSPVAIDVTLPGFSHGRT